MYRVHNTYAAALHSVLFQGCLNDTNTIAHLPLTMQLLEGFMEYQNTFYEAHILPLMSSMIKPPNYHQLVMEPLSIMHN